MSGVSGAPGDLGGLGLSSGDSHSLRHSDQLRQRARAHLSHELATMDLDRGFASSDFGRYLLIEKAGDDP
jgi:hypothetical protein